MHVYQEHGANDGCHIEYQLNGKGEWIDYKETPIEITYSGETIQARLSDGKNTGEASEIATSSHVDDKAPTVEISSEPSRTTRKITVTATGKDDAIHPVVNEESSASGIAKTEYSCYKQGETGTSVTETTTPTSHIFDGLDDGATYVVKIKVTDQAGRTGEVTQNVQTDIVKDGNSITIDFGNDDGHWVTETNAILSGSAQEGCHIQYKLNNAEKWLDYESTPLTITHSGETVQARWSDGKNDGQGGNIRKSKHVDDTAPTASIQDGGKTTKSITVTTSSGDTSINGDIGEYSSASGVQKTELSCTSNGSDNWIPENNVNHTFNNLTQDTNYTVKIKVTDNAGRTTTQQQIIKTEKLKEGKDLRICFDNGGQWVQETRASIIGDPQEGCHIEYDLENKNKWIDYNEKEKIPITYSGEIVKARFSDGTNDGQPSIEARSTNVDDRDPTVNITSEPSKTTKKIIVNITESDDSNHPISGFSSASGIATTEYSCLKGGNAVATNVVHGMQNNYTFDGLEAGVKYTIKVKVTDNSKRESEVTRDVTTESVKNGNDITISFDNDTKSGWVQSTNATITGYPQNECYIEYNLNNNSEWQKYNTNQKISIDYSGEIVKARYSDGKNRGTEPKSRTSERIDDQNPTARVEITETTSKSVSVKATGEDLAKHPNTKSNSGIKEYRYVCIKPDNTTVDTNWTKDVTHKFDDIKYTNAGLCTIKVKVRDQADRESVDVTATSNLKQLTSAKITLTPDKKIGEWTNDKVNVTINTTETGATLQYKTDWNGSNNDFKKCTNGEKVPVDKQNTEVFARLTDGTNTTANATLKITNIDKEPPKVTMITKGIGKSVEVTATATDKGNDESGSSGVDPNQYYFSKDQGLSWTDPISYTSYTFSEITEGSFIVKVHDKAGNIGESVPKNMQYCVGGTTSTSRICVVCGKEREYCYHCPDHPDSQQSLSQGYNCVVTYSGICGSNSFMIDGSTLSSYDTATQKPGEVCAMCRKEEF